MSGYAGFTGLINDGETEKKMLDLIKHRGPDNTGFYSDGFLCAGYCVLNTLTENNESEPLRSEDGSLLLFADAVIYNHLSLRKELEGAGHVFYSGSDNEVLLHLYEEYGVKILDRIRGMFSFLIYDKNKKSLFFARDPFGVKPVYYCETDGGLIFGSEIKCIIEHPRFKKELNADALESYLTFQYSVLPETFFKGVYRILPGHYMIYEINKLTAEKYFTAEFKPDAEMDFTAAVDIIDGAVNETVGIHTKGNLEIGAFLSSGVDSSYITAVFGGEKTFTVGFETSGFNETDYSAPLAMKLNKKNFSRIITADEYFNVLPEIMYRMDEPLADPSAVALYFASELASKHVKVALSGEAADEFFGGYNIYKECVDLSPVTALPSFLRKCIGALAQKIPFSFKGKNYLIRGSKNVEERFIGNANIFTADEIKKILKNPSLRISPRDITGKFYESVKHRDDITKMQFIDINLWLPGDILLKADRMGSAHSLEIRSPLLDSEVFKTAAKIPTGLKVSKKGTKFAFRGAAFKYLPKETAEKKKLGFPVPIRAWLRDERFYEKIRAAFSSKAAEKYFNNEELIKLLDSHYSGKCDAARKIWTAYVFLIWHEQYFYN